MIASTRSFRLQAYSMYLQIN